MDVPVFADQQELTNNSFVWDTGYSLEDLPVAMDSKDGWRERERERERELGKSVLSVRHDDDDDDVNKLRETKEL